jgi:hypothetical protein
MKRVAILSLVAVVFALAPAAVNAQGLFGSGLPSLGGFFGGAPACGPSACGEKCGPAAATTFYVGWMDDPNGVGVNISEDPPYNIVYRSATHRFRLNGLWLGLTQSCPLTENIGLLASGWYLIPSNRHSRESYGIFEPANNVPAGVNPFDSNWSTQSTWWFVDGLLAFGPSNIQLLAGLRYDYLTTKFDRNANNIGLQNSTADARSEGWIPLVGLQLAQASGNSNLLVRVVGIPTLVGTFHYREAVAGQSFEGSSNYNGGYFIEGFAEYGYKMGGMGEIGLFARYNNTRGRAKINFDLLPTTLSNDYQLGLHRSAWTFGAKFSLNFTVPYI